jgi:hypothetical protein
MQRTLSYLANLALGNGQVPQIAREASPDNAYRSGTSGKFGGSLALASLAGGLSMIFF